MRNVCDPCTHPSTHPAFATFPFRLAVLKSWWEAWSVSWGEASAKVAAQAKSIRPPDMSKGLGEPNQTWNGGAPGEVISLLV